MLYMCTLCIIRLMVHLLGLSAALGLTKYLENIGDRKKNTVPSGSGCLGTNLIWDKIL